MKRLLIASFLLIGSVSMLAVAHHSPKKQSCARKMCCMQQCPKAKTTDRATKTDYLFWEPIGRLMIIPQ